MKIKIQKLNELAQVPSYAKDGDAGMDLVAISKEITPDYVEYGTGLAFEIPEGHVGLLFPRSSVSKHDLQLCNSVGVVDSGYRGEVKFRFNVVQNDPVRPNRNIPKTYRNPSNIYEISDKIGQIIVMPIPRMEFEVVDKLEVSERGSGGFGSSGK